MPESRDVSALDTDEVVRIAKELRLGQHDADIAALEARLKRMRFERDLVSSGQPVQPMCW